MLMVALAFWLHSFVPNHAGDGVGLPPPPGNGGEYDTGLLIWHYDGDEDTHGYRLEKPPG